MKKSKISLFLNILIFALVLVAWAIMYFNFTGSGSLAAAGLWSLRYFTVLSNVFAGIVSLIYAIMAVCETISSGKNEKSENTTKANKPVADRLFKLKYISTTAVALTFAVVAFFLAPLSSKGYFSLFRGANLFFHLIIPLLAMLDFMFFYPDTNRDKDNFPFCATFLTIIPTALYGTVYLLNILINGIGEGKTTNDWYGFARWGIFPGGVLIFLVIMLLTWLAAILLRAVHNRRKAVV